METDEELEARYQKMLSETPEAKLGAAIRELRAALLKELDPLLRWLCRPIRWPKRKAREEE